MAQTGKSQKKKPYLQAIVFGVLSITSYVILFAHQSYITEHYTRGGIYAALPVGTALYFSFLHGAFASSVLSVLGIEAKKH
jgi:hypothetical protein